MKDIDKVLQSVEQSMAELYDIWDEGDNADILNNSAYPFEKSFDEVELDFKKFRLECQRLIKLKEQ